VAVSARSGAVLARRSTRSEAPGFVLAACGNRRTPSRCPPCSERYRRDAYFRIAAGLSGSEEKGVSTEVASHPLIFATFTAPLVRRRSCAVWSMPGGGSRRCRPGGASRPANTGIPMRCLERTRRGRSSDQSGRSALLLRTTRPQPWNGNLGSPVASHDHVSTPRTRGPGRTQRLSAAEARSAVALRQGRRVFRLVDRCTSMR